jgi:hypothetical protein
MKPGDLVTYLNWNGDCEGVGIVVEVIPGAETLPATTDFLMRANTEANLLPTDKAGKTGHRQTRGGHRRR